MGQRENAEVKIRFKELKFIFNNYDFILNNFECDGLMNK